MAENQSDDVGSLRSLEEDPFEHKHTKMFIGKLAR